MAHADLEGARVKEINLNQVEKGIFPPLRKRLDPGTSPALAGDDLISFWVIEGKENFFLFGRGLKPFLRG